MGLLLYVVVLTLIWLGKKIDDLKLVNYSFLVVIFLSFAALFFSFINGIIFLTIGIFFLRLSGQGSNGTYCINCDCQIF